MKCTSDNFIMNHLKADLYHCPGCGLIKSGLNPLESIYNGEYARKYRKYAKTDLGKYINHERWIFVKQFLNDGVILDYGCGVPIFDRTAGPGFEVYNFDINKELGLNDVSILKLNYDAIAFWDSLEHLDNPLDTLRMLKAKFLFITTPCTDTVKDITDGWPHYRPFEHKYYFNKKSLSTLLEAAGYRVVARDNFEGRMRRPSNPDWLMSVAAEKL